MGSTATIESPVAAWNESEVPVPRHDRSRPPAGPRSIADSRRAAYSRYIERHVSLPASASSPGQARRVVQDALVEWGYGTFATDAALLVSELVTNALLHAHTEISLTLAASNRGVRVEVADEDPAIPIVLQRRPEAATGRGMLIVDRLASSWGVDRTGTGKAVWFELSDDKGSALSDVAE